MTKAQHCADKLRMAGQSYQVYSYFTCLPVHINKKNFKLATLGMAVKARWSWSQIWNLPTAWGLCTFFIYANPTHCQSGLLWAGHHTDKTFSQLWKVIFQDRETLRKKFLNKLVSTLIQFSFDTVHELNPSDKRIANNPEPVLTWRIQWQSYWNWISQFGIKEDQSVHVGWMNRTATNI